MKPTSTKVALLGCCLAIAACSAPVQPSVDAAVDAGADCVTQPPPRLIAPLSGTRVLTRTPTLRWVGADATAVHVDICRDRACGTIAGSMDVTGNVGTPAPLATGVTFWRAYARTPGCPDGAPSATWQFRISTSAVRASAASWGHDPDFNGDGYDDLVVNNGAGAVSTFQGGPSGPLQTSYTALRDPSAPYDGAFDVMAVGDLNGDGFVDLGIATRSSDPIWTLRIFPGGRSWPATTDVLQIPLAFASSPYAAEAGIGDFDGDGYGDIAVVPVDGSAAALVYRGSASLGMLTPYRCAISGSFGAIAVNAAGDVDGDGLADLFVVPETGSGALLFLGRDRCTVGPIVLSGAETYYERPSSPGGASGDTDGNGYCDLVNATVGLKPWMGHVLEYAGLPGGPAPAPDVALMIPTLHDVGPPMAPAGDVNGDGFDELLVDSTTRAGVIYWGATSGISASRTSSIVTDLGVHVVPLGDVNGDGYDDVAALGLTIDIYLGNATATLSTPAITLTDPQGMFPVVGWAAGP